MNADEDGSIDHLLRDIDEIWKTVPATSPMGIARIDVLAGPVFDTVLHEVGHAIFEF